MMTHAELYGYGTGYMAKQSAEAYKVKPIVRKVPKYAPPARTAPEPGMTLKEFLKRRFWDTEPLMEPERERPKPPTTEDVGDYSLGTAKVKNIKGRAHAGALHNRAGRMAEKTAALRYCVHKAAAEAVNPGKRGDEATAIQKGLDWIRNNAVKAVRSIKDIPKTVYDTTLNFPAPDEIIADAEKAGTFLKEHTPTPKEALKAVVSPQGIRDIGAAASATGKFFPAIPVAADAATNIADYKGAGAEAADLARTREPYRYYGGTPAGIGMKAYEAVEPFLKPFTLGRAMMKEKGTPARQHLKDNLKTRWYNLVDEATRGRIER